MTPLLEAQAWHGMSGERMGTREKELRAEKRDDDDLALVYQVEWLEGRARAAFDWVVDFEERGGAS